MLKFILALTVILVNVQLYSALPPSDLVAVTLLPNSEYRCCPENETKRELPTVYCYYGTHKSLVNVWQTVSVFVEMKRPEKYDIFEGTDEADVWAQYESSQSKWGFNLFNWGRRSIVLNPFNTTCLGIRTTKNYTLKIHVTQVNKILVGMFTLGALLFFLAPVLVHNQIFYYTVGITIGVLASALVFLYFIITLLPLKRPAMIGMMAGGSTVIIYFFQSFLNNILALLPMYTQFLYGYLIVSGFISFIVCYRFGPLSNPRSKNIIQWSLEIISLFLVFFSSYNQQVAVILAVFITLMGKFPLPKWIINAVRNNTSKNRAVLVSKKPTPKRRSKGKLRFFLSQEEYREQGKVETERGLEEIRHFCRTSPHRWAAVQRRIDSRNFERLAKFMTGEPHVSREEMEAKMAEELLTDEEE